MHLIILAAGKGSRIFNYIGKHKCLIDINNKTLMNNLINKNSNKCNNSIKFSNSNNYNNNNNNICNRNMKYNYKLPYL